MIGSAVLMAPFFDRPRLNTYALIGVATSLFALLLGIVVVKNPYVSHRQHEPWTMDRVTSQKVVGVDRLPRLQEDVLRNVLFEYEEAYGGNMLNPDYSRNALRKFEKFDRARWVPPGQPLDVCSDRRTIPGVIHCDLRPRRSRENVYLPEEYARPFSVLNFVRSYFW
jgi:hypothetical protein